LGITAVDHADIYDNYRCEEQFGQALALDKGIRKKVANYYQVRHKSDI